MGSMLAEDSSIRLVCRVCQKQYANYTCPRCNLRYCSLHCYKGHSARCTESFSRDNVLAEMKNVEVSPENKRKMLESLKRVYESEENDEAEENADESSMLSEETLRKVITGGGLSLEDLSVEEYKAFKRAVAAGHLSHLIKPWEPWWLLPTAKSISLSKHGTNMVHILDQSPQELSGKLPEEQSETPTPPAEPLPPLSQLTKVPPSASLPVHLVDILYSYCFVLRLYNGDWKDSAFDAATDLLTMSRVLTQTVAPESITEVISYCMETINYPAFRHAGGFNIGLIICEDVATMLRMGRCACICALADMHKLFEAALNEKRVKKLQVGLKKVYYMLCWVNEFGDSLPPFASFVEAEKQRLVEIRAQGI